MDTSLPTHVIVAAGLARARAAGAFAYVRQRGDADRGTLLIALNDMNGTHSLHRQIWDGDQRRLTPVASGSELETEDLIKRESSFDRDLWIIEIEDKNGQLYFDTILHESAAV